MSEDESQDNAYISAHLEQDTFETDDVIENVTCILTEYNEEEVYSEYVEHVDKYGVEEDESDDDDDEDIHIQPLSVAGRFDNILSSQLTRLRSKIDFEFPDRKKFYERQTQTEKDVKGGGEMSGLSSILQLKLLAGSLFDVLETFQTAVHSDGKMFSNTDKEVLEEISQRLDEIEVEFQEQGFELLNENAREKTKKLSKTEAEFNNALSNIYELDRDAMVRNLKALLQTATDVGVIQGQTVFANDVSNILNVIKKIAVDLRREIEERKGIDKATSISDATALKEPSHQGENDATTLKKPRHEGENDASTLKEPHHQGETDATPKEPHHQGENDTTAVKEPHHQGENDTTAVKEPHHQGETDATAMKEPRHEGETDATALKEPHHQGENDATALNEPRHHGETDATALKEPRHEDETESCQSQPCSTDDKDEEIYDSEDEKDIDIFDSEDPSKAGNDKRHSLNEDEPIVNEKAADLSEKTSSYHSDEDITEGGSFNDESSQSQPSHSPPALPQAANQKIDREQKSDNGVPDDEQQSFEKVPSNGTNGDISDEIPGFRQDSNAAIPPAEITSGQNEYPTTKPEFQSDENLKDNRPADQPYVEEPLETSVPGEIVPQFEPEDDLQKALPSHHSNSGSPPIKKDESTDKVYQNGYHHSHDPEVECESEMSPRQDKTIPKSKNVNEECTEFDPQIQHSNSLNLNDAEQLSPNSQTKMRNNEPQDLRETREQKHFNVPNDDDIRKQSDRQSKDGSFYEQSKNERNPDAGNEKISNFSNATDSSSGAHKAESHDPEFLGDDLSADQMNESLNDQNKYDQRKRGILRPKDGSDSQTKLVDFTQDRTSLMELEMEKALLQNNGVKTHASKSDTSLGRREKFRRYKSLLEPQQLETPNATKEGKDKEPEKRNFTKQLLKASCVVGSLLALVNQFGTGPSGQPLYESLFEDLTQTTDFQHIGSPAI